MCFLLNDLMAFLIESYYITTFRSIKGWYTGFLLNNDQMNYRTDMCCGSQKKNTTKGMNILKFTQMSSNKNTDLDTLDLHHPKFITCSQSDLELIY